LIKKENTQNSHKDISWVAESGFYDEIEPPVPSTPVNLTVNAAYNI